LARRVPSGRSAKAANRLSAELASVSAVQPDTLVDISSLALATESASAVWLDNGWVLVAGLASASTVALPSESDAASVTVDALSGPESVLDTQAMLVFLQSQRADLADSPEAAHLEGQLRQS